MSFEKNETAEVRKQALEGIRILDFTWAGVGPMVTKALVDHGAISVRIESATHPDPVRVSPAYRDGIPGINRSAYGAIINNNKYSFALNLNHPRAAEVVRKLVAWGNIVAENFTPGTMEKWGLGYEEVKKMKPDMIMLSTCMQGQTGPNRFFPGFGWQMSSLAGFYSVTGWPDRAPTLVPAPITDYIAYYYCVVMVMAALDYRRKTGNGLYIDLSQLEAGVQFLAPAILDYGVNKRIATRQGNSSNCAAPHGAYRCQGEDRWCAIAVFTDDEWRSFCRVIGRPVLAEDPKFATLSARKENEKELNALTEEWTSNYSPEQVMRLMQAAGVAAGVVQNAEDLFQDPQLSHRECFQLLRHSEIGLHAYPGLFFRLSATPGQLRMPAPCLGEHTEYICRNFLGISGDEFIELFNSGVFE